MSQSGIYGTGGTPPPPSINQIDGDSGFAAGATINIITGFTAGPYQNGTIQFVGDDISTLTLQSYDSIGNLAVGHFALSSVASGGGSVTNTAFGNFAGASIVGGAGSGFNCLFGQVAGSSITQGHDNMAFGVNALGNLLVGIYNIGIGSGAGDQLTGPESSNIYLNSIGVTAESNTLRIGSATGTGNQNLSKAFICGIDGVNVGSVATVVTEASDQLGTAVLTAGTGISITPGANTITIATTSSVADSFPTDSGTATPVAGVLNIVGDSSAIVTSGSGNTVTVHFNPLLTTVSTTPYNATNIDFYIAVNASGSPITIRLPNTTTTGRMFVVKDYLGQANLNNIIVTSVGGVILFDGFPTYTMNAQYQSANFIFDGTNYQIW